jgi:beta-N-acetylhexosaminidase
MSEPSNRTLALRTLMPGFVGTTLPGEIRALLAEGLGGVCIFGENVESRDQLSELIADIRSANPAAVVSIDEEGGDVTRLYYAEGSPFPGNAVLGRIDDLALTEEVGASVGRALAAVGVTLDLAPDADVNSNPLNPVIGVRSFGADTELVARHTAAWVAGLQSAGVAACAKHFPGHGDTSADSHHALPVVDAPESVLREREFVPFVAAIEGRTRTIMTSHIVLPQLDDVAATFSPRILRSLLRDELGFAGVVVTDALDMAGASAETGIPEAAVRALAAGADLLCIGTRNTAEQLDDIAAVITAAVEDGRLPEARLRDAGDRVLALASGEPLPGPLSDPLRDSTAGDPIAVPLERIATAFDVADGVRVSSRRTVVALDTTANMAIGAAPWGPAAAHVGEGEELPGVDGQLVLVGKDNHRHPWVRDLISRARRDHPDVLVIDMGWPDESRTFADVATFGAARVVGAALDAWLEREAR